MSERWVIDASPLILLSRIGQLDLLTQLTSTLQIPKTVMQEIHAGVVKDAAAKTAVTWQYRGKSLIYQYRSVL